MSELNKFYPSLTAENGNLSIEKCLAQKEEIERINEQIALVSLQKANESAQKMFFVHAFNFHVIDKINENQPLKSIEDIDNFYDGESFTVSKGQFTLRSLHHYILSKFEDPNVIFALYLGGNYSPKLTEPSHKHYEKYFEKTAKEFLNNDSYIRVKPKSERLMLPEFMKWNMKAFGIETPDQFTDYINKSRSEDNQIPKEYKVSFYPYSWRLE